VSQQASEHLTEERINNLVLRMEAAISGKTVRPWWQSLGPLWVAVLIWIVSGIIWGARLTSANDQHQEQIIELKDEIKTYKNFQPKAEEQLRILIKSNDELTLEVKELRRTIDRKIR